MPKPIKWSSLADYDFANLLDYLEHKWSKKVCLTFIEKLDNCILQIQNNPESFPVFNEQFKIRKCVVTKQNSLFYRENLNRIEILRLYDTRQNPESLNF